MRIVLFILVIKVFEFKFLYILSSTVIYQSTVVVRDSVSHR